MSDDTRQRPSRLMISLYLGTAAQVSAQTVDRDGRRTPALAIYDADVAVTVEPHGPIEGGPVRHSDIRRANQLVDAAIAYRDALGRAFADGLRTEGPTMPDNEPVHPHRSALQIRLQLGTAAEIGMVTIDQGTEALPVITIEHAAIEVTIEPYGPGEYGRVSRCDVIRAAELATAAFGYLAALNERYAAETAAGRVPDADDPETFAAIARVMASIPPQYWPTPVS